MAFFVELAGDEYGNRGYTNSFPCVIEAKRDENDPEHLFIIAPPEIASKWPSLFEWSHGGWLECDGPARPLGRDEREALIARTWVEHFLNQDFDEEKCRDLIERVKGEYYGLTEKHRWHSTFKTLLQDLITASGKAIGVYPDIRLVGQ